MSDDQESCFKQEGNLAKVFMGIILVFLICHLPRNILNFHEIATIENAIACMEIGKRSFPFWALAMTPIRYLMSGSCHLDSGLNVEIGV